MLCRYIFLISKALFVIFIYINNYVVNMFVTTDLFFKFYDCVSFLVFRLINDIFQNYV